MLLDDITATECVTTHSGFNLNVKWSYNICLGTGDSNKLTKINTLASINTPGPSCSKHH